MSAKVAAAHQVLRIQSQWMCFTFYLCFLGSDLLFLFCFLSCVRSEGLYILKCDWKIRYCIAAKHERLSAGQSGTMLPLTVLCLPASQFDAPSAVRML